MESHQRSSLRAQKPPEWTSGMIYLSIYVSYYSFILLLFFYSTSSVASFILSFLSAFTCLPFFVPLFETYFLTFQFSIIMCSAQLVMCFHQNNIFKERINLFHSMLIEVVLGTSLRLLALNRMKSTSLPPTVLTGQHCDTVLQHSQEQCGNNDILLSIYLPHLQSLM